MKRSFTGTIQALVFAVVLTACAFAPSASAQGPANFPPTWVFARAYAAWNVASATANTYTFNGGPGSPCYASPYNNGQSSSFFVFSGTIGGSVVYNPVAILDANPTLSEIVTPTSTTNNSSSTCGFAASTTNSHISFNLVSGTAGLQEAIEAQFQGGPPAMVVLDQYWYNLVYGLPGHPTPESIIKAATGSTGTMIVDTTSSPWTYWRWSGSAYAATSLTGGSSAPTAAAGAAAGTSPTISDSGDGNTVSVSLTAGSATTTGTLFTLTWATSAAFLYPPVCNVWSSGSNSFTAFTTAVTYPSSTHALLTVTASSAPTAATAYAFKAVCQ
jgi:hypothetical protein